MASDNKSKRIFSYRSAIFLIVVAVILCYINTLHNPFIWDDEEIVVNNYLIRSWKHIPEMFKASVFGGKLEGGKFYRPLQLFSYSIDYSFWKLNPLGYHISNIIFHLLNALLVFFLLIKLGNKRNFSFFVSLFFAIHPINTEAVTYISGRGDLLFLFFSLLCFVFFINGSKGKQWHYFISVILYILAILSKESAIVIPLIILVYYYLFLRKKKIKHALGTVLSLLAITLLYIVIRFGVLGVGNSAVLSLINEATLWQRILTLPRILITYIALLIFPRNLHMEYLFVEKSLVSPYIIFGIPFLLVIFYLVLRYVKPFKLSIFFLSWFLIGLGPFYNVILPLASTLREHWVYLSGIGFLTLIVLLGSQLLKLNKSYLKLAVILISVFLIVYYSFYTIARNRDWNDPLVLYKHDLRYEPQSFLLHNNVGVEYFRRGEMGEAKKSFLNSIETSPGFAYDVAHNNLGVVLENEGKIDEAISEYKKSIEIGNYQLAYSNLARVYLKQKKLDEAINVLEEGFKLYPLDVEINYYLGIGYFYKKQFNYAYKILINLEKIYPGYKDVRVYLEEIKNALY